MIIYISHRNLPSSQQATVDCSWPHHRLRAAPPVIGENGENGPQPLAPTQPLWARLLLAFPTLPEGAALAELCSSLFVKEFSFPLMSFSLLCGSHGVHPCSYVRFETLPFGVRFHAYFLASQLPNSVTMTRPHLLPSAKWNLHCLVIKVLCGLNKIQIVLYLYVL